MKLKSMLEILQEYPDAYFREGYGQKTELVIKEYSILSSDWFPYLGTEVVDDIPFTQIPYEVRHDD